MQDDSSLNDVSREEKTLDYELELPSDMDLFAAAFMLRYMNLTGQSIDQMQDEEWLRQDRNDLTQ